MVFNCLPVAALKNGGCLVCKSAGRGSCCTWLVLITAIIFMMSFWLLEQFSSFSSSHMPQPLSLLALKTTVLHSILIF